MDLDKIKLLSRYCSFLKNNYLEQVAEENRHFLSKVNLQLLKLSKDLSVEDLLQMSTINLKNLLSAFEDGKITDKILVEILKLELETLPGLKSEHIESNDLLSIYTAQKQALISFIPKFTSDTHIMMDLIQALEFTFLKAIDFTLQNFIDQRIESATKITEGQIREKTSNHYIQELKISNDELKNKNEMLDKIQEELTISYEELRNQNENFSKLQSILITRQDNLVEKEIELIRSNQHLEQFASIASHDLKEPLRMVKQYVQLLAKRLKGNLDHDITDFVGFTVDGVDRMEHLIKSLLDYAKLNKLGVSLDLTNSELALDRAKINLSIAIAESHAEITNDELPFLKVNSVQLTQIFQNLLSNAIKYRLPDTKSKIHISVEKKENYFLFCISDNGIGIDSEYFKNIFLPFQRLHTHREYEGIGLGLSFCKKIIERFGGDMWVESEVGKGSNFFFTILES
ncbi:MAG: GHKL domain-containing protein [Candidatus Sericytochromatia bacterium]|nr:GHKL domain-containing protein [Candidatus Sericytochromatia bacterium]